ncbi:GAF and ANTAR domain-containing protein [Microbacterium sp. SLBN-154]|uniref:GAF and ANTAR domain-containing protein n=1 Tax=Microbacterium sp. SLBN-154 TaxID=2768458 RepID=UPI001153850B|nr:GAF and ANTAR domain-containing protein [Microbacterium sp. SLBN-154]
MDSAFAGTLGELKRSRGVTERYSSCFLEVLPVSGAAVSTLGEVLGTETVSATDTMAARLDEIQFDVGEGPCWDAARTAAPVAEVDLQGRGALRWPAFGAAVHGQEVASIFAFPLHVGGMRLGAVDLYSRDPMRLDDRQYEQASAMAGVIGRHVLSQAISSLDADADVDSPYSRRVVHQATGVVLAQLDIDAEDAALIIGGHAFAAGATTMEVSRDIIQGRLRFVREGGRIEARR